MSNYKSFSSININAKTTHKQIAFRKKHPYAMTTPTSSSLLPDEIITEILLRLPTKSLSKFMCVSKSCLHRLLFRGTNGNFKPPLFTKQQLTKELFHIDSPLESSTLSIYLVGSVNGLICVGNGQRDAFKTSIQNKSKQCCWIFFWLPWGWYKLLWFMKRCCIHDLDLSHILILDIYIYQCTNALH